MPHLRKYSLFIFIVLLFLPMAWAAQPVQAGQPEQTVPTAGPSPTRVPGGNPGGDETPPAPTAVLATSPVGGVQPTATSAPTQTLAPGATAAGPTPIVLEPTVTNTPASQITPDQAKTDLQATQTALPTLISAAPVEATQPGGALCFPIGIILLVFVVFLVLKLVRRAAGKQAV